MAETPLCADGAKIKAAREAKKPPWSQETLAEKAGYKLSVIQKLEQGTYFSLTCLNACAEALEVLAADLLVSSDADGSIHQEQHTGYTDGDWITAAIVGPEQAETMLKKLAGSSSKIKTNSRDEKVEQVALQVQSAIDHLLEQHAKGGHSDETRLNACIAKFVADVLQRELANFRWNVDEQPGSDPVKVFRDTVKAFIDTEQNKWKA